MDDVIAGAVFEHAYPFVRGKTTIMDEDGPAEIGTWNPGIHYVPISEDECDAVAEGLGKQILTVVSVHKPGRFPTRVFYTRKWETPRGKRFGKSGCHITTLQAFRRLIKGYRVSFKVVPTRKEEKARPVIKRPPLVDSVDELPF